MGAKLFTFYGADLQSCLSLSGFSRVVSQNIKISFEFDPLYSNSFRYKNYCLRNALLFDLTGSTFRVSTLGESMGDTADNSAPHSKFTKHSYVFWLECPFNDDRKITIPALLLEKEIRAQSDYMYIHKILIKKI